MGFFRKAKPKQTRQQFIGRKFRSGLSADECLQNYRAVRDQCYDVVDEFEPVWSTPDPGAYESAEVSAPEGPPVSVVASTLSTGGVLYLAVWGGTALGGDTQMWFVPPEFDGSPIPLAGVWKMRDSSLSSIGSVERPFWGVPM